MASPPTSPSRTVQQPRVRLQQETVTTLVEWQLGALRRGWPKPSYGELLDAAVAILGQGGVHPFELIDAVNGAAAVVGADPHPFGGS